MMMKPIREEKSRFRKFIINVKDFKIIKRIGRGGFGSVYSVQNLKTKEILAAKVININGNEETYKRMINREVGIMIKCQHPTIIKFKGFSITDFHEEKNVTIFMEYAKKGSLSIFLQKVKKGLLDEIYNNTNKQILLIGISRGMMYLHQNKIIHRDLKADNILLDDNLHPLITDFGLSKFYGPELSTSQSQQCGTLIYMAPEIMEGFQYNGKVDVYSFGILMYEIVTDSVPYPDLENKEMTAFQFTSKVVNENYRPKFEVPVKKSIRQLIKKCWSKNPKERPTFDEIFKKLAYNIEDSIDDIYDDVDFGKKEEEMDAYYLDDVDVDEVLFYADEIDEIYSQSEDRLSYKIEQVTRSLRKENEELKKLNNKMIQKFNELSSKFEKETKKLQKENKEMKNLINDLNSRVKSKFDNLSKEVKVDVQKERKKAEEITCDEFNDLTIQLQQEIVSKIKNENQNNHFLSKVNNLLVYLLQFNPKKSEKYLRFDQNEEILLLNNLNQICLLSNSIELVNESLLSSDFINILSAFDKVYIELNFPSSNFEKLFLATKNLKSKIENKILISILFNQKNKIESNFKNNVDINCVRIGSSIVVIESYSFYKCSSLIQVFIPSSVSIIESYAFSECKSLTHILLSSSLIEIKPFTFGGCSSLTQISIPSSVTSIGESAFTYCSLLKTISIPPTVTEIGASAFKGCKSLEQIIIPSTVTAIGNYTFYDCSSLTQITIPLSVTYIGGSAFNGCSSLTQITIPSSITQIGGKIFDRCPKLNQITIEKNENKDESLKYIDKMLILQSNESNKVHYYLFFAHPLLDKVNIPPYVTSIFSGTFSNCTLLTQVIIPSSVLFIGNQAFYNCSSLTKISIPSSVKSIDWNAFGNCSSLTQITIPSSVTSIGQSVFSQCKSLKKITIPSSVTSIDHNTFSGCLSLTKISIPASVTSLGSSCFFSCSSLSQITIPASVHYIGDFAFFECISLTQITIPASVHYISENAFHSCKSLKHAMFLSTEISFRGPIFKNCPSLCKITIPPSLNRSYILKDICNDPKIKIIVK